MKLFGYVKIKQLTTFFYIKRIKNYTYICSIYIYIYMSFITIIINIKLFRFNNNEYKFIKIHRNKK